MIPIALEVEAPALALLAPLVARARALAELTDLLVLAGVATSAAVPRV
jgi:hypothetical protein